MMAGASTCPYFPHVELKVVTEAWFENQKQILFQRYTPSK